MTDSNKNSSKTADKDAGMYHAPDPDAAGIVKAALIHIPFDGWSDAALKAGAVDAGLSPEDVVRLFPGGALDAILLHSQLADISMVDAFESMTERPDRVHLMIRELILIRLDQAALHKEAVRRALAMLALPANALISARALYATVDTMWRAAGQMDTDFSFYTKRATLAAVYSSTLLVWLADTSGDSANIESFLDRRLGDVAKIPKATAPMRGIMEGGRRFAEGVFGAASRRARR